MNSNPDEPGAATPGAAEPGAAEPGAAGASRSGAPAGTTGVEVYADIWCPFAYLGLSRLLAVRDRIAPRLPVVVRAWPLEQVNGEPLRAETVTEEARELRAQVAPELFAGLTGAHFPSSTLPALGLAARAYQRGAGVGEQVSMALRRALFEADQDVSDPAVLSQLAARFDLDLPGEEQAGRAVAADYAEGRRRGVRGSPHFFLGPANSFCPNLTITRVEGRLRISLDQDRLPAWLQAALAAADSTRSLSAQGEPEQV